MRSALYGAKLSRLPSARKTAYDPKQTYRAVKTIEIPWCNRVLLHPDVLCFPAWWEAQCSA
jgi:hypothetical protein